MRDAGEAVVLTYHSISKGPPPLCIAPEVFAAQMAWLKAHAHVVSLSDLVESLARGAPLPPRTVTLTFDDGFRDFYTEAAPILRVLKLTATVFLPAAYCGRIASWNSRTGQLPVMTWDQVRELAAQGLSFGSHGMSHPVLVSLEDSDLACEIAESKRLIEAESRQNVDFFCYPYGRLDERTKRVVRAHYSGGACSTELRAADSGDDRFAIPRIDAHYVRHPAAFRAIITGGFRFYLAARRIVRDLRPRAPVA